MVVVLHDTQPPNLKYSVWFLSHLVSLRREPHGGNLGLTCVHSTARPAVWSSFPENDAYYNQSKETTVLTLARL